MAIAFIRKACIILTAAVLFGANTVEARAQESIPDGVDNSKLIYFPPLRQADLTSACTQSISATAIAEFMSAINSARLSE